MGKIASRFGIVQFGLTIFKATPDAEKPFEVRPSHCYIPKKTPFSRHDIFSARPPSPTSHRLSLTASPPFSNMYM